MIVLDEKGTCCYTPSTMLRGCNSVGRVSASQAECRGFESHHPLLDSYVRGFPAKNRGAFSVNRGATAHMDTITGGKLGSATGVAAGEGA